MADYYDRDGNRLADVLAWAPKFEDRDYQRVAVTEIGDVMVSTVWLGLDHNYVSGGPPLIFETMVFGGPMNDYQERYATEAEALAGHDQIVTKVQQGAIK